MIGGTAVVAALAISRCSWCGGGTRLATGKLGPRLDRREELRELEDVREELREQREERLEEQSGD